MQACAWAISLEASDGPTLSRLCFTSTQASWWCYASSDLTPSSRTGFIPSGFEAQIGKPTACVVLWPNHLNPSIWRRTPSQSPGFVAQTGQTRRLWWFCGKSLWHAPHDLMRPAIMRPNRWNNRSRRVSNLRQVPRRLRALSHLRRNSKPTRYSPSSSFLTCQCPLLCVPSLVYAPCEPHPTPPHQIQ